MNIFYIGVFVGIIVFLLLFLLIFSLKNNNKKDSVDSTENLKLAFSMISSPSAPSTESTNSSLKVCEGLIEQLDKFKKIYKNIMGKDCPQERVDCSNITNNQLIELKSSLFNIVSDMTIKSLENNNYNDLTAIWIVLAHKIIPLKVNGNNIQIEQSPNKNMTLKNFSDMLKSLNSIQNVQQDLTDPIENKKEKVRQKSKEILQKTKINLDDQEFQSDNININPSSFGKILIYYINYHGVVLK